jgi:hypothetical protein
LIEFGAIDKAKNAQDWRNEQPRGFDIRRPERKDCYPLADKAEFVHYTRQLATLESECV